MLNYINKFIPFDINQIFKLGDPIIFGGAIRDTIAKMPIHDLDIVAIGKTHNKLHEFFIANNYHLIMCNNDCDRSILGRDIAEQCPICSKTYQIEWFDVTTYIYKSGKSQFINQTKAPFINIQLIKPKTGKFFMSPEGEEKGFPKREMKRNGGLYATFSDMELIKDFIVKEVDINCCGVSYSSTGSKEATGLKEAIPNAIKDCEKHIIRVNENATFYNAARTYMRKQKLIQRGWIEEAI